MRADDRQSLIRVAGRSPASSVDGAAAGRNTWLRGGVILLVLFCIHAALAGWLYNAAWSRPVTVLFVVGYMLVGVGYLLTIRRLPTRDSVSVVAAIIVLGLAMRLVLLPTPVRESDQYRYLWDGALLAHGVNPYERSPGQVILAQKHGSEQDPRVADLARQAGGILPRINHPQVKTIYPPFAQAMFALAYAIEPWSSVAWRCVLLLFDLTTLALLILLLRALQLPLAWVAIYWWNPLAIKEFYSEAHLDVIVLPAVVGAMLAAVRGQTNWAAACLAVGVAGKLWPAVLLAVILRPVFRRPRKLLLAIGVFAGLSAALLSPMLWMGTAGISGVGAYARDWESNAGLFRLLVWMAERVPALSSAQGAARFTTSLLLLLWTAWLVRKPFLSHHALCRAALATVAGVFILSPTQFPWYYTWMLPLLVVQPSFPLLLYTALLPLCALQYDEPLWAWPQHLPVLALLVWSMIRTRIADTPLPPDETPAPTQSPQRPARVAVIIPALNEAAAIGKVIAAVPAWVNDIIVVDNGSTDATADVARSAGARVVSEPRRGYGAACLAGIGALKSPEVVVFLDADFSDDPSEMARLVRPILTREADLVIGSRVLGRREAGALTLPQRFGNALACTILRLLYGVTYSDLGPFRAIRYTSLRQLQLDDTTYGWTVQMQAKAARCGLHGVEVPVNYRRRIGQSKISGTVRGVFGAGTKILYTLGREWFRTPPVPRQHLAVFARYPEPGRTKTRLIPVLGPEQAAQLQRQMTAHTLAAVRRWRDKHSAASPTVRFAGGDAKRMGQLFGPDLAYTPQGDGDLGERLLRAMNDGFTSGSAGMVMIGTDCPGITSDILAAAFKALQAADLVVGPAADGGYYLIGVRSPWPELFENVAWGTETVLAQTLATARRLGLSVHQLPMLHDVDRPEDLAVWQRIRQAGARQPLISVVIPTLNEEGLVAEAICSARAPDVQILVVDGGSTDHAADIAESYGVTVIQSGRGRARQMNTGAAAADGDILLFLHADSKLPQGYVAEVQRIMAKRGTAAGAFPLLVTPPSLAMRVVSATTNARSRWFELPYGDQAIFLPRRVWQQSGGFPELEVMEDLSFVQRLRRLGRIRLASSVVSTSARRWRQHGTIRMTLLNQLLIVAFYLGLSPGLLLRWRESGRLTALRRLAVATDPPHSGLKCVQCSRLPAHS